MKVVVDTNIIFSASLSKNSKFREILSNKNYEFYAPYSLYSEIIKNLNKIKHFSKDTNSEVNLFILKILEKINFIHLELVSDETYKKAYYFCKE